MTDAEKKLNEAAHNWCCEHQFDDKADRGTAFKAGAQSVQAELEQVGDENVGLIAREMELSNALKIANEHLTEALEVIKDLVASAFLMDTQIFSARVVRAREFLKRIDEKG